MPTTAIYTRISNDPQGLRAGVERQRQDCLALAGAGTVAPDAGPRARTTYPQGGAAGGAAVTDRPGAVTLYEDNDTSAYRGKPRPAYQRMCADLAGGVIDTVVVWHPDRLHRSLRELEDFIDLIEATGATVRSVSAGDFDLATPEGRLTARITGSVARKESEDKSRRLRRKHEELAELGQPKGGGRRALGFEPDGKTHRQDEAERLREAAGRLLAGASLKSTAAALGFEVTSLRKALLRPRMAGLREHRGEIVGPAAWEPILDEVTWRALCRLLTDPERRGVGGRTRQGTRVLSGLARCGKCNSKMWLASARGVVDYRCWECGGSRIRADWLDELVGKAVLAALDGPGLARTLARKNEAGELEAAKELEAAQTTLVELASDWGSGALSRVEYLAAKQGAEQRRIAAQRKLDGISSTPVLAGISGPIREAWETADIPRRRSIVAAVVDSVVVNPALTRGSTVFDRDRIKICWKA